MVIRIPHEGTFVVCRGLVGCQDGTYMNSGYGVEDSDQDFTKWSECVCACVMIMYVWGRVLGGGLRWGFCNDVMLIRAHFIVY